MSDKSYIDSSPILVLHPGLNGRTAVVTGGANGMGACFTEVLMSHGVNVVSADIDGDGVAAKVEALNADENLPGRAVAVTIDVRGPDGHTAAADLAIAEFGQLDFWVNNAGIFPEAFMPDVPADLFRRTLEVNVDSVMHGGQAAAKVMKPGGAIVNMVSIAAATVRPGRSAYGTSKAAVEHLTHFQSVELGRRGIRVNGIAPGFVDTAMTDWIHTDPARLETALGAVPLGRIGTPDEIAAVLLFLLSDSARYVNGHVLAVDGGSRY